MEALASARLGITTALTRFEKASETLVASMVSDKTVDPVAAISDGMESRAQFKANMMTSVFADEMLQGLIDMQCEDCAG